MLKSKPKQPPKLFIPPSFPQKNTEIHFVPTSDSDCLASDGWVQAVLDGMGWIMMMDDDCLNLQEKKEMETSIKKEPLKPPETIPRIQSILCNSIEQIVPSDFCLPRDFIAQFPLVQFDAQSGDYLDSFPNFDSLFKSHRTLGTVIKSRDSAGRSWDKTKFFSDLTANSNADFLENLEYHKLMSVDCLPKRRSNHPISRTQKQALVCHFCCRSTDHGELMQCDYCPLCWHLDCVLPYPLTAPPPSNQPWMCPAHSCHCLPASGHRFILASCGREDDANSFDAPNTGRHRRSITCDTSYDELSDSTASTTTSATAAARSDDDCDVEFVDSNAVYTDSFSRRASRSFRLKHEDDDDHQSSILKNHKQQLPPSILLNRPHQSNNGWIEVELSSTKPSSTHSNHKTTEYCLPESGIHMSHVSCSTAASQLSCTPPLQPLGNPLSQGSKDDIKHKKPPIYSCKVHCKNQFMKSAYDRAIANDLSVMASSSDSPSKYQPSSSASVHAPTYLIKRVFDRTSSSTKQSDRSIASFDDFLRWKRYQKSKRKTLHNHHSSTCSQNYRLI